MQQNNSPAHRSARADAPALRTLVNIPARWGRFLRRVTNLPEGRYMIVLTVGSDGDTCDWSIDPVGSVER